MLTRRSVLAAALAAAASPATIRAAGLDRLKEGGIRRIAFGSCAKQWKQQPIWDVVRAQDPDLFLFLGDAIYGDWHGGNVFAPTADSLRADWAQLASIPEFSRFRDQVPIVATWDNHDYGKHAGGAEFELTEVSKQIFLDFFSEPTGSDRRTRPGIYDVLLFGEPGRRIQIIMLDGRSFKDPYIPDMRTKATKSALGIRGQYLPNTDPAATLLGVAQWSWLEDLLRQPAEVRLICSGTQIVADQKGMEEWGNFPHERRRLFELIASTGANGVVFLSGNVHFSEISATGEGPYRLFDFTSSGMTHNTPEYAVLRNRRRVSGPFAGFNFGMIELNWNAPGGGEIVMTSMDASGQPMLTCAVQIQDLRH